jgi:hypothetical protein
MTSVDGLTTIENKVNGINNVFPKCYLGFPALFRALIISLLQHATSRTQGLFGIKDCKTEE